MKLFSQIISCHCVKSVRIPSYSGLRISPRIRVFSPNEGKCWKNADQNNCEYGHFLRSVYYFCKGRGWGCSRPDENCSLLKNRLECSHEALVLLTTPFLETYWHPKFRNLKYLRILKLQLLNLTYNLLTKFFLGEIRRFHFFNFLI